MKLITGKILIVMAVTVVVWFVTSLTIALNNQATRPRSNSLIRYFLSSHDAAECRQITKKLTLAIHAYYEHYDCFPPAVTEGPTGVPWHSWRTLIVPFHKDCPKEFNYRMEEPWNSLHNFQQISVAERLFQLPLIWEPTGGETHFLAPVDRRTAWQGKSSLTMKDLVNPDSTIHFLTKNLPNHPWTEPIDMTMDQSVEYLTQSDTENNEIEIDTRLIFFSTTRGAIRRINRPLEKEMAIQLLLATNTTTPLAEWPDYLPNSTEKSAREIPRIDVSDLANVEISLRQQAEIQPGKTTIWCASMASAWKVLRNEFGGNEVQCEGSEAITADLNRLSNGADLLSDSQTMVKVEQTTAPPELKINSVLHKSMPFENLFELFQEALKFEGNQSHKDVTSMGFQGNIEDTKENVFEKQLNVIHYDSDQAFVVQLETIGETKDRITLAMLPPEKTLIETWEAVDQLIQSQNLRKTEPKLQSIDTLQVPIITFNLMRNYDELLRPLIISGKSTAWKIVEANEHLRFRLDEAGADLYSDISIIAIGSFGEDPDYVKPQPRFFIYNRPFLVAVQEENKQEPCLLMWIDDPALLENWE
ncbi:DUF1559 domain-containing protein [Rubinisphaera sp.]|uniref:DUF1559 family PulG-like putative transporter n=1 Tax=Rubinisphaera sp. TaxID=2024857 RepID=UPI000EC82597|nr:DUF1559 domain-containing protein [Rubinisphaera sp.]HCS55501.1 hypothetical protein [Planctomycetaceae bacterium]|tara:strand:- start:1790 stop:3550 length:1761 start_codon:yes stop_codon:yes gene_type:complete